MMKIRERYCEGGVEFMTFCTDCGTSHRKVVSMIDVNTKVSCETCGKNVPKMFDMKEKHNFNKIFSHWTNGVSSENII